MMTTTTASVQFRRAAIAVSALAAVASADIMTLSASGTIDSVDGFGFPTDVGTPSAGDLWSLNIVYESTAAPSSGFGDIANYSAVTSYELTLNERLFSATPGLASVQRLADSGPQFADGYYFFGEALVNEFDDGIGLELQLFDFDPFLGSLALPTTLDLTNIANAFLQIDALFDGQSNGFTGATGTVDRLTLAAVPSPSAAIALAFAGVAAARRRR